MGAEAAEQAKQAAAAGEEPAGDGRDGAKGGGDLTVALREERAKRRQAEAQLAQVLSDRKQAGGEKGAEELQIGIEEDDLLEGRAEEFNAKLQKAIGTLRDGMMHDVQGLLEAMTQRDRLMRRVNEHEIFEDPTVGDRAMARLADALRAHPDQDPEDIIEDVAREFSELRVAAGDGEGGDAPPSPPPAGGGSEAAFLRAGDPPKSARMEDIRAHARSTLSRLLKKRQ